MKLQIREALLQIIQIVVLKVGLNEAVLLQQILFKSHISLKIRDDHKWVYKTYAAWKSEMFPVDRIKRTIRKLEKKGSIVFCFS